MATERRALTLSAVMSLVLGSVGLGLAVLTGSQVILLDGLFNLIYFAIALLTVRVAYLVSQPDTEKYPFGFAYFESLVNAGKGLLILGVSLLALGDSVLVLFAGGREIVASLAIFYAAFATFTSTTTFLILRRVRQGNSSPLVDADYENWFINTIISASVLLAFCLIPLARWLGYDGIVPYVDPILVAFVVVVFCLGVPFRMASRAIKELLNRAPPRHIRGPVREAVDEALAHLPSHHHLVRMVRPGRTLYLSVYVVMPEDYPLEGIAELDRIRGDLDARVRQVYPQLVLDVVFTTQAYWAAPTNGLAERQ